MNDWKKQEDTNLKTTPETDRANNAECKPDFECLISFEKKQAEQ